MNNWFLRDGLVFHQGKLTQKDLWIQDGKIADPTFYTGGALELDCNNLLICRGFIDCHTHLREPGGEDKETIESGTKAAARGGFTTVCAMPNTNPPLDNIDRLKEFNQMCNIKAKVKVEPIAAVSLHRSGLQCVDFTTLRQQGVKLFSDDGDAVASSLIIQVMNELAQNGGILINHLEDNELTIGGMFQQEIPSESEYTMLARDLDLVAKTGCRYHAAHLSCARSVELIAQAKADGLPVSAEVTPHHLVLTYQDIRFPQGNFQMKPPLRSEHDRQALIQGLADGVIDLVATDHAPHGREKQGELHAKSPFGVTGLETAFAVLYTKLVLTGQVSLVRLLASLTISPASLVNQPAQLEVGTTADVVVLDLNLTQTVQVEDFCSKGINSPFIDHVLSGWPVLTLVDGKEQYNALR